jgi:phosphate transport system substrate-binding protein
MGVRSTMRLFLLGLLVLMLAAFAAGCGGDDDEETSGDTAAAAEPTTEGSATLSGSIAGAGSSAQAAAQEAWIAGFQTLNPDTTVAYDPVGSGGGREQFVAGGTDFGGTDAALADEELTGAQDRCGGPDNLIEIPDYVSPIAIAFNIEGIETLNMSPETVAKIFNQDITNWNDQAIAADNPDVELPDLQITPVNRSDESGTTENFVEYLSLAAPDVWTYEVSGDWPVPGGEAAEGTSGVVASITNGNGTIGYADESQTAGLGIVNVGVGSEFVGPSADAAAQILNASPESDDPGQFVFTFNLDRNTEESGTYPVVLVSYLMACTQYDSADTAAIVQAYINYIISPEGQDVAHEAAGSAPITDELRDMIQPAVDAIQAR